jgi:3-oxoacyl-[acyl-carrier-protein] synthase II
MKAGVVVTGLGVVSALGHDPGILWSTLAQGRAGIPVDNVPSFAPLPLRRGYYLEAPVRAQLSPGRSAPRASDYAVVAAHQAVAQAGLDLGTGVVGTAFGSGMGDAEDWRNLCRADPSHHDFIFRTADRVAEVLDLGGPSLEISTACSAGAYALAVGTILIEAGEADAMICGGADAPSFHAVAAFNRLGALDPLACRPFDRRRAGTVFGEGAAVLVLEHEDAFRARGGGRALARLKGFGMSCDAYHPTAPAEDGVQIERAMREAIARAGIEPAAVRVAVPHATGTVINDRIESMVMSRVFGESEHQPWSLPLKGYAGHGGGMSGALSALVAVLMIAHDAVPPTPWSRDQDLGCAVRLPDRLIEGAGVGYAIINALAFGGHNISLVFAADRREANEDEP